MGEGDGERERERGRVCVIEVTFISYSIVGAFLIIVVCTLINDSLT